MNSVKEMPKDETQKFNKIKKNVFEKPRNVISKTTNMANNWVKQIQESPKKTKYGVFGATIQRIKMVLLIS